MMQSTETDFSEHEIDLERLAKYHPGALPNLVRVISDGRVESRFPSGMLQQLKEED
jgi:hypothetical protein